MTQKDKLIGRILSGASDKNIDFHDLIGLLDSLGFSCRVKGSHNIFYKDGIEEIINIQPLSNNKAKPYQVKQIRFLILKYKLNFTSNE
ncbi:MAG: type II toxin-antitoxin system HicA family toxin [Porphyromonadaceae bacterium]|nr:MAG: type II toxin-antitoxin system HicA family toxin [Porphyromonadaceae bacterium]